MSAGRAFAIMAAMANHPPLLALAPLAAFVALPGAAPAFAQPANEASAAEAPQPDEPPAPAPAALLEKQAAMRTAFVHQQFAEAGLAPIADAETLGRQLRRVMLHDPYGMLPLPVMELERRGDGQLFLTLHYREWREPPVPVDPALWDALLALEPKVFAALPPPADPPLPQPTSAPPLCHGWSARIAAGARRTAVWAACARAERTAELDYAERMVRLALATRPGCAGEDDAASDGTPFWAYNSCFGEARPLDDPALAATVGEVTTAFEAVAGSSLLAEARRRLRDPAIAHGNPAWQAARTAIEDLRQADQARRELIRQLDQLRITRPLISEADRTRITAKTLQWSRFLDQQQANYAGLLEQLVAVPAPGPPPTPPARP